MEQRLTKDEILTRYLNTVYFGEGAYGIEAAAKTYFGVHASELDPVANRDARRPDHGAEPFRPLVRPASAVGRRDVVLADHGRDGHDHAAEQRQCPRASRSTLHPGTRTRAVPVPVFRRLLEARGSWPTRRSARRTTTATGCCSPAACGSRPPSTRRCRRPHRMRSRASCATRATRRRASPWSTRARGSSARWSAVDDADYWANIAAGRVNLATGSGGSGRQTGSAFKAFALVAALENGYSADTTFAGARVDHPPAPGGGTWHGDERRRCRATAPSASRTATEKSVNTVYAQLIQQLGADTVVSDRRADGDAVLHRCRPADRPAARRRQRGARHPTRPTPWRWPAPTAPSPPVVGALTPVPVESVVEPRRDDPVAGRPRADAGRRPAGGGGGQRHPAGRRAVRHGYRGEHRTAADRQDRHRRQPRQRVVRRRRPPARRGGVGRIPRGTDPDGAAAYADHRLRRHVAGADLAIADAEGDGDAAGRARSRRREVRYTAVAVDTRRSRRACRTRTRRRTTSSR